MNKKPFIKKIVIEDEDEIQEMNLSHSKKETTQNLQTLLYGSFYGTNKVINKILIPQSFTFSRNVIIKKVCAGDNHLVLLDELGYVYTM